MLPAGVVGALLCREDALLVPDRFVKGLAQLAESHGVRIMTGTEAIGFRTSGGRITGVETTRGAFSAGTVVLAAGAWSPDVGRALGLRVPIQPAKGYSLTYRRPARAPTIPLLPAEGRFSVTPMGEFLRFGGTLELAGMDLSINRRRVEALRRKALACLEGAGTWSSWRSGAASARARPTGCPSSDARGASTTSSWRPATPWSACRSGPATGKLVAQLAGGATPPADCACSTPTASRRRGPPARAA